MKLCTRTILGALLAIGIGGCANDASRSVFGEGPAVGPDAAPGPAGPDGTVDAGSQSDAASGDPDAGSDAGPDAPPPIPGKTFALTGGADSLMGEEGDDTFASTLSGAFGAGDVIDGAEGNDTISVFAIADVAPTGVTVSNVENAILTSLSSVNVDTSSWSGLTHLTTEAGGSSTVTAGATTDVSGTAVGSGAVAFNGGRNVTIRASHETNGTIDVGSVVEAAGTVSVSSTSVGAVTMGAITVKGGTAVSVQQAATNPFNTSATLGPVTVNGTGSTTSVAVSGPTPSFSFGPTMAALYPAPITISDVNADSATLPGTITSAVLSGYGPASINDNALTSLSLASGTGNVMINNGNLNVPTNKTLRLTVDGLKGGSLIDAGVYTTLDVTTVGAPSRLANISQSAVQTLTVGGSAALTLTSTAGLGSLGTVVIKDAAGLTADLSSSGTVTSVTNLGSGPVSATIDPSKATYTGGSGSDRVTFSQTTPSKAIDLGAGDDVLTLSYYAPSAAIAGGAGVDMLVMDSMMAATASGSSAFGQMVTGFESLTLRGATNQNIDVSRLGAISRVATWGGNGLALQKLPSGGTLELQGAGTAYTVSNPDFLAGANDVINLVLTDASSSGVNFAATGIMIPDAETVAITTVDGWQTPSGSFHDTVTLLGNYAKTITVAGTAGLSLTATDRELTVLDASGITVGGFTFWGGALLHPATIKGSTNGANFVDLSAAAMAITYWGGAGNDTVTLGNANDNIVALGNGNNSLVIGNGSNVIAAGSGDDTIMMTGAPMGPTSIDVGSGNDMVALGGIPQSVSAFTSLTGMGPGDLLDIGTTKGTAMSFSSQTVLGAQVTGSSTFAGYLDACAAGIGNGVTIIKWFQLDGKTYIVHDTSAAATFQAGSDTLIELVGLYDLSAVHISNHTILF